MGRTSRRRSGWSGIGPPRSRLALYPWPPSPPAHHPHRVMRRGIHANMIDWLDVPAARLAASDLRAVAVEPRRRDREPGLVRIRGRVLAAADATPQGADRRWGSFRRNRRGHFAA